MRLLERLTRRTRRRAFVVLTGGIIGLSVPLWVPRMLASLPAFRVETVRVVGVQYVAPTEVIGLAAVGPEASVWDDPSVWEARVETHPLVLEARVRRDGIRAISIQVVEDRPVALVATPTLLPVSAEGRVLPLEPWTAAVDLPLLTGHAELEDGRLADPLQRDLVALIGELGARDPEFVQQVSEFGYASGRGYEFLMLPTASASRVLLPVVEPGRGLRRVLLALGQTREDRIWMADARYADQVVLSLEAER
jgi:hypothetical protein